MTEIITRAEAKALGLKRYYTGEPCKHGHVAERQISDGCCVVCDRERRAAWRAANQERVREINRNRMRAWRAANPERARAAQRHRYAANPELVRAYRRRWDAKNPDKVRAQSRRHYVANKTKIQERMQRYIKTEQGRSVKKAIDARRRASSGSFTAADWRILVARSPHCHWCKRRWTKDRRPTHDHVYPLSRGGENSLENSVCACRECNSRKGAGTVQPGDGINEGVQAILI